MPHKTSVSSDRYSRQFSWSALNFSDERIKQIKKASLDATMEIAATVDPSLQATHKYLLRVLAQSAQSLGSVWHRYCTLIIAHFVLLLFVVSLLLCTLCSSLTTTASSTGGKYSTMTIEKRLRSWSCLKQGTEPKLTFRGSLVSQNKWYPTMSNTKERLSAAMKRRTVEVAVTVGARRWVEQSSNQKIESPGCFKGTKTRPVRYRPNREAWVTQAVNLSWNLKALCLGFLLPNTTSVLQPWSH